MAVKLIGADVGISDDGNWSINFIVMDKWTAGETGNVTEIRIKAGGNNNVKFGIYANVAGEPGALLNSNQTGTAIVSGWNTVSIASTPVTQGVDYWLALNSNVANARRDTTGSNNVRFKSWAYGAAWPSPAGSGWTTSNDDTAIAGWGTIGVGVKKKSDPFPPFFSLVGKLLVPTHLLLKS